MSHEEEDTTLTVSTDEDLRAEALVERMFLAGVGAFELLCVHLGHRLGLYRALAELGPKDTGR